MADGRDGFVGRCEVVEARRKNRRWPDDLKARIVVESFQLDARVVDVVRRLGMVLGWLQISSRIGGVLRVRVF